MAVKELSQMYLVLQSIMATHISIQAIRSQLQNLLSASAIEPECKSKT